MLRGVASTSRPAPTPARSQHEASAPQGLRIDAERNRQRLVAAAKAAFAERGIDVPLEEIAQRAGVGIATLYRRFPTRDALLAAAFEEHLAEYAAAAAEALRAPDAWSGFCGYLERVAAMQATNCGARDVLTMTFPSVKSLRQQRDRAFRDFAELIERAKAEGHLRADFVAEDFMLLQMANAGVVRGTRDGAPQAWKRFVALMLDACRAERAHPLPPPPPPARMYRAMRHLSRG
jgi:AcrR family transcriptional regulator